MKKYVQIETIDSAYNALTGSHIFTSGCGPNPPADYPCKDGKQVISNWENYVIWVALDSLNSAIKRSGGGGGGSTPIGTPGAWAYFGKSTHLSEMISQLVIDTTNWRVGIGSSTPITKLDIEDTGLSAVVAYLHNIKTDTANGAGILCQSDSAEGGLNALSSKYHRYTTLQGDFGLFGIHGNLDISNVNVSSPKQDIKFYAGETNPTNPLIDIMGAKRRIGFYPDNNAFFSLLSKDSINFFDRASAKRIVSIYDSVQIGNVDIFDSGKMVIHFDGSGLSFLNGGEVVVGGNRSFSNAVLDVIGVASNGKQLELDEDIAHGIISSSISNHSGVLTFYANNVTAINIDADPASFSSFDNEVVIGNSGAASTAALDILPISGRFLYMDVNLTYSALTFTANGNGGTFTGLASNVTTFALNSNNSGNAAFLYKDGNQHFGKLLTSDASGNATWQYPGNADTVDITPLIGTGASQFSEPFTGISLKKVVVVLYSLNGTVSYTFPVPFTHYNAAITTNGLSTALITSLSNTSVQVTGTGQSGYLTIEGN